MEDSILLDNQKDQVFLRGGDNMVPCPNCTQAMTFEWDPYGKRPPRWVCHTCGNTKL